MLICFLAGRVFLNETPSVSIIGGSEKASGSMKTTTFLEYTA